MASTDAQTLLQLMRDMERLGLNRGTAGNASLRHDDGMLITPSGVPPAALQAEDMVRVDAHGHWAAGQRPSSEWHMHRAVYDARDDVQAVVHCHSRYATALACLRRPLPDFHYLVAQFGGTEVPCAAYASFGTEELGRQLVETLGGLHACLLANHGQVTVSASPQAALALAVELEELAAQYSIACSLGAPVCLGEAEMQLMLERFADYRGQAR